MKISAEEPRIDGALAQIRIDPHDGRCHGDHDIVITALPLPDELREKSGHRAHVSISWGATALLSITGSEEFHGALARACIIARRLRLSGKYEP